MRYFATLDKKRWFTAAGTFLLAFLSGYVMQNVLGAAPLPRVAERITVPDAPARTVSLRPAPVFPDRTLETRVSRKSSCAPKTEISEGTIGTVAVSLIAPCHIGKPVMLTLNGIRAKVETDQRGRWSARLPALASDVVVELAFEEQVLRTSLHVASASDVQHVLLVWNGSRTFHIQAETFGELPEKKESGLMTVGDGKSGPSFEVFSSPARKTGASGVVRLYVDATITPENCGEPASVTAYQTGYNGRLQTTEISYTMPECDRVGETVRLQNLFRDMRLASR